MAGRSSQIIGHANDGGLIRIVVGTLLKEVLGNLFRVEDDDLLVQQSGVDEVTWRY